VLVGPPSCPAPEPCLPRRLGTTRAGLQEAPSLLVALVFDPRTWVAAAGASWQALPDLDPADAADPSRADWVRFRGQVPGKALGDAFERRVSADAPLEVVDALYASQALVDATFDVSPRLRRLVATVETARPTGPEAYVLVLVPLEGADAASLRFDVPSPS
jgi:hypothetical protein